MERLAALEAEVKANADTQRARKAAAIAKLRDARVTGSAEQPASHTRERARFEPPSEVHSQRARSAQSDADHLEDLGGALELASKANRVRQELQRAPGKGEKSWIVSAVASLALGPAGWLYAGSLREAVPAATAWIALLVAASKLLPTLLALPVLFVVMPLSAIAGALYALQFNRTGKRQRLFTDKKKRKAALPGASASARRKPLRGGS